MKVQELFENKEHAATIEKTLKDLMDDVVDMVEDNLASDIDFDFEKSDGRLTYNNEGSDFNPMVFRASYKVNDMVKDRSTIIPTVEAALVMDLPYGHPGLNEKLKKKISALFKSKGIDLLWSNHSPWSFSDHFRVISV